MAPIWKTYQSWISKYQRHPWILPRQQLAARNTRIGKTPRRPCIVIEHVIGNPKPWMWAITLLFTNWATLRKHLKLSESWLSHQHEKENRFFTHFPWLWESKKECLKEVYKLWKLCMYESCWHSETLLSVVSFIHSVNVYYIILHYCKTNALSWCGCSFSVSHWIRPQ